MFLKVNRQVGTGRIPWTDNIKKRIFKMVQRCCSKNNRYHISSVRDTPAKLPLSKSTVHKILRNAKWKPYRPIRVQQLMAHDYENRPKFCRHSLQHLDLMKVLWLDEVAFSLNETVQ